MIRKISQLEARRGIRDIKIAFQGERPSSGSVASIPIRDGREAQAWGTAAYILAAPAMHKLLCEISEHMYTHNHHAENCAIEATGECTCGRDELLARSIKLIDQLEQAEEYQRPPRFNALGV